MQLGNQLWKRKMTAAALAVGLAVPGSFAIPVSVYAEEPAPSQNEATLYQVFETIRDLHWPNVDEDQLVKGAAQGMLDVLNDPYSEYFTAEEYQQFVNAINLNYAGIGIRLLQDEKGYLAEEVFPSSPAEQSGLKNGDRILEVDGFVTAGQPLDAVSGRLRGKEGTSVTLKIERSGQEPFTVTVQRQAIHLPTLTSSMLDEETGYIRILSFGDTVSTEFNLALTDLQRKGMKSLVLDLRGNGGGLLDSSVRIADRFLSSGMIVQLKERDHETQIIASPESVDLPVTVVIDQNSASASELLAGTLQAHKRANLVGQTSYGKGVMQTGLQMNNGSILKLTVGQYYFVDGTSPQGIGLKPDISVGSPSLQVPVAVHSLYPDRSVTVQFNLAEQKTFVNNNEVLNQKTITKNGVHYVPLRFGLEVFGSQVSWNSEERAIAIQYKDRTAKLLAGTGEMVVNDQKVKQDYPFFVEDGVSYISLEALQDILVLDKVNITSSIIELEGK